MASTIQSSGLFGTVANVFIAQLTSGTESMKPTVGAIGARGLRPDSVFVSSEAKTIFDAQAALERLRQFSAAATDTSGPISSLQQLSEDGFGVYASVPEDNVVIFAKDPIVNQKYTAKDFARVWTGTGNDEVTVEFAGEVATGDGEDVVTAGDAALVETGADNDTVNAGHDAFVYAGTGDDVVIAGDRTQIDGGAGDDTLTAGERGEIVGGTGADTITVGAEGYAEGGTGDDTIVFTGSNGTVYFDAGDGEDTVTASGKTTVMVGSGLSSSKLRMEVSGDDMLLSFEGSSDTITFKNYKGTSPKLVFSDGTEYEMSFGA